MAVSYTLLMQPKFQSLLADGTPNAGGKVYTYAAGTTTLATTYSDPELTTPNTNPIVLDAEGQADIWFSGPYKLVCQNANGVQLWSADQLFGFKSSLFCSLPVQDQDKLLAWDAADKKFKNSTLNLSTIETAVNAFSVSLLNNGAVVVADVGDISPGTLNDKLLIGGGLQKTVETGTDGAKHLRVDSSAAVNAAAQLYLAANFMTP